MKAPRSGRRAFTTCWTVAFGLLVAMTATALGQDVRLPNFPLFQQPDDYSCGPTSAAMVLGYYGKDAGIGPLKTEAGTRWLEVGNVGFGLTLPAGLRDAMARRGVMAELRQGSTGDLWRYIDAGKPVILLVRSGRNSWHYVVVTGYVDRGREYWINDPAGVTYTRTAEALQGAWQFSHDLNGNYIPDLRCEVCAGTGQVNQPGINVYCVVCGGSGKIRADLGPFHTGMWTVCPACGGSGRIRGQGPRIPCPACLGRGNFGDPSRKAVEAFASGNLMLVPVLRPDQLVTPGPQPFQPPAQPPNQPAVTLTVRFVNSAPGQVTFSARAVGYPDWASYVLQPGQTQDIPFLGIPEVSFESNRGTVTTTLQGGAIDVFSLDNDGVLHLDGQGSIDQPPDGGLPGTPPSGDAGNDGGSQPSPTAPAATPAEADLFARNLGIWYQRVNYTDGTFGAKVARDPVPGSPAARIGLEPGDIVFALDGMRFRTPDDVVNHTQRTTIDLIDVRTGQNASDVMMLP